MRDNVFLPAKTGIPHISSALVPRPRLISALSNIAAEAKVALILGPAGYGKTALVSSWAMRERRPLAYLSLDPDDATPNRFWGYFAESLRVSGICEGISLGAISERDELICWIDALIARLSQTGSSMAMVIEDFHNVAECEGIVDTFSYLISHLPDDVSLVITSRSPVGLSLARMRAEGTLGELTEQDLKLTVLETRELMVRLGKDSDEATVKRICDLSEGWPLAVRVLSMSCGEMHGDRFLSKKVGETLRSYLFEEVFRKMPQQVLEFAKSTALIGRFTFDLAVFLTGWPSGEVADAISYLVDNGLFIAETKDSSGTWYGYHALFSFSLVSHFGRDEQWVAAIRGKACDWFEAHGFYDEAILQAASSKDDNRIARIILSQWQSLYSSNGLPRLARWFASFSDGYVDRDPLLSIIQIAPLAVTGQSGLADLRARKALEMIRDEQDERYAILLAVRSIVMPLRGNPFEARLLAQKALDVLPDSEVFLRSMVQQTLSGTLMGEDLVAAKEGFERALELQRATGYDSLVSSAHGNLALVTALMGSFRESDCHIEQLEGIPECDKNPNTMLVLGKSAEALSAYCRGDAPRSKDAAAFVRENARFCNVPFAVSIARICEILSSDLPNEHEAVRNAVKESPEGVVRCYPPLSSFGDWIEAGLFAGFGKSNDRGVAFSSGFHSDWACLATDYLCGKKNLSSVARGNEKKIPEGLLHDKVNSLVLLALCEETDGNEDEAVVALSRAFRLAENEKMVQPFFKDVELLFSLWKKVIENDPDSYAGRLFDQIPSIRAKEAHDSSSLSLTAREIEIAEVASLGLSNEEIARRLFISRETVKKHLGNIYAKTGTHSKIQAVSVLRELGLIP